MHRPVLRGGGGRGPLAVTMAVEATGALRNWQKTGRAEAGRSPPHTPLAYPGGLPAWMPYGLK